MNNYAVGGVWIWLGVNLSFFKSIPDDKRMSLLSNKLKKIGKLAL